MRNKVLIITSKNDEHADYIIARMNDRGLSDRVIRLNTEDFSDNVVYSFDGEQFKLEIQDSERKVSSFEICTVWYRRPIKQKISFADPGVEKFVKGQFEHFVNGLYYILCDDVLWINEIKDNLYAKNKLYQLNVAKKAGFKIPKVLISNDSKAIEAFVSENEIICNKSLTVPHYEYKGIEYPYMTRLVNKEDILSNIESLNICPTMFQGYLEKKYDIRVVVFGEKMYAFAIYSQENDMSRIDVRGLSPLMVKHEYIELPTEIVEKIKVFMKMQNLYFSSIDLILSADNEYYFIENNCNGQWLWLENVTGKNMSDEFIDCILKEKYDYC